MSLSPNHRNTIDQEVYKWVAQQNKKKKVVTPNGIRQRAFEIGQEYDPNFKASLNWYNNWKKRFEYNESPEAEALKHKKRSYTAAFKLHAVQRAMELESASQASLELDVSRRCLQRWKEELDLIASVAEHSSNAVYRRPGQGRKVHDVNLDAQLLDWVKESWKQGINISSGMIREKARELSTQPNFKASLGWFVKWQKRHSVDLKEQTCSSPPPDSVSPLKLRLLPEGEVSCYSTSPKRKKAKRRKLTYDDEALLENDEEFDRLLLTWLVERWEAGDIVNDKMLKEKAMEITSNPDFKSSKVWLLAWKRKYNVSLENQTYGNEGDEENEEIVEESEVYDNEVLLEDQGQGHGQQTASTEGAENSLTPSKEQQAASALASLSTEDHEAGLEIAEALQKLANAFGITTVQGPEAAKEAMAQLTAAYQGESVNPEFLLEEGGQVAGVEEVVSEEVVTDEPMVVIEAGLEATPVPATAPTTVSGQPDLSVAVTTTAAVLSQTQPPEVQTVAIPIISEPATQPSPEIATQTVTQVAAPTLPENIAQAVVQAIAPAVPVTENIVATTASSLVQFVQTPAQVASLQPTTTVVATSPISTFVSEEVVISEPVIETTTTSEPQVEVLVQGGSGMILFESQDTSGTIVQPSAVDNQDIWQPSSAAIANQAESIAQPGTPSSVTQSSSVSLEPAEVLQAAVEIIQPSSAITAGQEATEGAPLVSGQQILTTSAVVPETMSNIILQEMSVGTSVESTDPPAIVTPEMPIPVESQEIIDIVQETIASSEKAIEETVLTTPRVYDEEFKARVVSRAQELGSVQQAAREFSVPLKVVATWNTQQE